MIAIIFGLVVDYIVINNLLKFRNKSTIGINNCFHILQTTMRAKRFQATF